MLEALDTQNLRQNLVDAGCGQDTIQQCMNLARQKKLREMKRILTLHRRTLLDMLHADKKRIDCLDYLVYHIDKQTESK